MKFFVKSQFGYCPLIWMFHSRRLNNKINSIHERALRITYQDHISIFQLLLNKDNSVSIHHRNLQALATEMFKIQRDLSPDILREIFVPKISLYNLRRNNTFERRQVHSVYHGTESLSFLYPKSWDLVPLELKQLESLEVLKLKIKKWIPFEPFIYNKLGLFKAVRLTIIFDCYYHFYHLRCLYDNIYQEICRFFSFYFIHLI